MQKSSITDRHSAIITLRGSWWVKDRNVQRIFEVLDGRKGRTRAVGGIVRDSILFGPHRGAGGRGTDIDMATELLPNEVMALARKAGMACYETGIEYGTVTIRNGDIACEVTTLRQDIKTDGRRAVVEFGTDWVLDARRRDFTINALYCDMSGNLFDPLAAFEDLKARRVRFIGDPDQRLAEDRLRVYRFFRFTASHGDEIGDHEGLEACKRFSGELGNLPAERIGAEMEKIFALPKIAATLAMMTKANVLDLDIGSLKVLASYEDRTGVPTISARLAILLSQIKIEYLRKSWRLSNSICSEAVSVREVAQMMIAGEYFQAAYKYGRLAYVALPVAAAIANWADDEYEKTKDFWDNMDVPSFPVSGNDLLRSGFAQGEKLGRALRHIEAEWVKSGFKLSREQLLEKLQDFLG
ncbi:MAG: hypothetical protein L3J21_09565 [Devosiaceae bacterium]|nr:hypothetical protein [Devosiaceae bacterium]